ncbi:MAG TPA: SAF domain-containing protein [Bacillota bacterium]|nr:SAF domain-containing protein [Bacillota bacterium]
MIAIVLGALLAWFVVQAMQTQHHVIVLRQDVPRGSVITAEALGQTTVGTIQGVSVVPAEQIPQLVGKTARIDLAKGALMPADATTEEQAPAEGKSLVGLMLRPGKVVSGAIVPGSAVRLIALPGDSASTSGEPKTFQGTVVSVASAADGVSTLLNVEVPSGVAPQVQLLAAQDRIAVVQDAA